MALICEFRSFLEQNVSAFEHLSKIYVENETRHRRVSSEMNGGKLYTELSNMITIDSKGNQADRGSQPFYDERMHNQTNMYEMTDGMMINDAGFLNTSPENNSVKESLGNFEILSELNGCELNGCELDSIFSATSYCESEWEENTISSLGHAQLCSEDSSTTKLSVTNMTRNSDATHMDIATVDKILGVSVSSDGISDSLGQSNSLPALDELCENYLDFNNETDNSMTSWSCIPNFDILLPETKFDCDTDRVSPGLNIFSATQNLTAYSSSVQRKPCTDNINEDVNKYVINVLRDLQAELLSQEDNDDFGLTLLFEENRPKQRPTGVRSKSSKKRKKQVQKLQRCPVPEKSTKRKFAQSFEELQLSRPLMDEIDSSITCPVCLEMYHLPSVCNPCGHTFCDPCLRRLACNGTEGIPCPLCRAVISSCDLSKDFDDYLIHIHPDIYTARAKSEKVNKYRHYLLPYTAPVPLGKRLMRQLIASRNNQSDQRWMSHDWFKFLLGCTVGMCLSLLLMLFNRVKSVRDARDVNIVFLSILIGATATFLVFKFIKI